MAYGIETTLTNGTKTISQTLAGGRIFVGYAYAAVTGTYNTKTVYTYPEIPGGNYLRIIQIGAGAHGWEVGTNALGQATITLSEFSSRVTASAIGSIYDTNLQVFATYTNEPDYGVSFLNDLGERTISSVYPSAYFLERVTSFNLTVQSTGIYTYSGTSTLSAGKAIMILWQLPDSTTYWFRGDNSSPNFEIYGGTVPPTQLPVAYVFALGSPTASTETYGMRVYNASGNITFDSGLNYINIKGFETTFGYPTSTDVVNTYTLNSLSGNTSAFFIPQFSRESWSRVGTSIQSRGYLYYGLVQKSGNVLSSMYRLINTYYEDTIIIGQYQYGLSGGLTQVVVDATLYGGT